MKIEKNIPCPCGALEETKLTYGECCGRLHAGIEKPKTAEELLRSRYSAFVTGDIDYVIRTTHSKMVSEIKRDEIETWSKNSTWHGLRVMQKEGGELNDEKGSIIFEARYELEGKKNEHFEKSFFEKENGVWKFFDAQGVHMGTYVREAPKTGRNDPCTCGSGKKFKKCCGGAK